MDILLGNYASYKLGRLSRSLDFLKKGKWFNGEVYSMVSSILKVANLKQYNNFITGVKNWFMNM